MQRSTRSLFGIQHTIVWLAKFSVWFELMQKMRKFSFRMEAMRREREGEIRGKKFHIYTRYTRQTILKCFVDTCYWMTWKKRKNEILLMVLNDRIFPFHFIYSCVFFIFSRSRFSPSNAFGLTVAGLCVSSRIQLWEWHACKWKKIIINVTRECLSRFSCYRCRHNSLLY